MIHVTGCRVLVKPIELVEHDEVYKRSKAAGIALPELTERREQTQVDRGTVLQIGSSCAPAYIGDVKIGDMIGYARFGGKYFKDGNEDLLVLNDEDIICVFKDNE
jgi:co-chaperonin GroES (HSP10)